jgi:F420-dependent oxidoreductase-like protein
MTRLKACLSLEIQEGMRYPDTLRLAQTAEACGFDAALVAEHYTPSGPAELYGQAGAGARMSPDAWVYLGGLARETTRIRLGTLVSPVTFRHPAVLAKMAATLDHLSQGRAELGLGAGWVELEHAAYGFPFPPAGERVSVLEEQLQVIVGLWSQTPFTHVGRRYALRECTFTPAPVQRPRPTIIVGGSTTAERLPRLAARYADEYDVGQATPEQCRAVRERLDRACEAVGRDPASLRLSVFLGVCVAETAAEVERLVDVICRRDPQYERLRRLIHTWVKGTPDEAAERLRALEAAGVERVMLSVNAPEHEAMVRLIGDRVLPLLP